MPPADSSSSSTSAVELHSYGQNSTYPEGDQSPAAEDRVAVATEEPNQIKQIKSNADLVLENGRCKIHSAQTEKRIRIKMVQTHSWHITKYKSLWGFHATSKCSKQTLRHKHNADTYTDAYTHTCIVLYTYSELPHAVHNAQTFALTMFIQICRTLLRTNALTSWRWSCKRQKSSNLLLLSLFIDNQRTNNISKKT